MTKIYVVLHLCLHEPEYVEVDAAFSQYSDARKYIEREFLLNEKWEISDGDDYFSAFSPDNEAGIFIQEVSLDTQIHAFERVNKISPGY